jgi:hypothetical protein
MGCRGGFGPIKPTYKHPLSPMQDGMVMLAVEIKCLSCGVSRGVFRCRRPLGADFGPVRYGTAASPAPSNPRRS